MNDNIEKNLNMENLEYTELEQIAGGYVEDPAGSYLRCIVLEAWKKVKGVPFKEKIFHQNFYHHCCKKRGTKKCATVNIIKHIKIKNN